MRERAGWCVCIFPLTFTCNFFKKIILVVVVAKRFFSSIHATYSYRYWSMLNRREVLFFVSRKLASLFTYTCHENRLSRKMVWNAQFVVIITTPLLTPFVTLRDKYLPGLKVKSQQHLILNLQCDAPYRGHPTNIFTSKKLANQGTRI